MKKIFIITLFATNLFYSQDFTISEIENLLDKNFNDFSNFADKHDYKFDNNIKNIDTKTQLARFEELRKFRNGDNLLQFALLKKDYSNNEILIPQGIVFSTKDFGLYKRMKFSVDGSNFNFVTSDTNDNSITYYYTHKDVGLLIDVTNKNENVLYTFLLIKMK